MSGWGGTVHCTVQLNTKTKYLIVLMMSTANYKGNVTLVPELTYIFKGNNPAIVWDF